MKTFVNNLDTHPFVAFIISMFGIGTGAVLHYAHPFIVLAIPSQSSLDVVVKLFQCAAYAGGAAAGFVSFHGWYTKRKHKGKHKEE